MPRPPQVSLPLLYPGRGAKILFLPFLLQFYRRKTVRIYAILYLKIETKASKYHVDLVGKQNSR